jgi:hypothetical protein
MASTAGIESTSQGDHRYAHSEKSLVSLDQTRDSVAGSIKLALDAAAFDDAPVFHVNSSEAHCGSLLQRAGALASGGD